MKAIESSIIESIYVKKNKDKLHQCKEIRASLWVKSTYELPVSDLNETC